VGVARPSPSPHLSLAPVTLAEIITMVRRSLLVALALVALPGSALAGSGYHPFAPARRGVKTVDLSAEAKARAKAAASAEPGAEPGEAYVAAPYPATRSFHELDAVAAEAAAAGGVPASPEPEALRGSVVVPGPVAAGELVDPAVVHAVEDIPGNEYPRKHTLYLNFTGGMLYSGADNSAESRSTLARQGNYPVYTGGEAKAIAAAQETAADVEALGINVVYLERPPKILPYTMVMIGGHWSDTNIDSAAAGVAPGTDCGALGQRHVVYTFATGGWSATAIANVNSQEAGHAWGLDHSLNCNSVMSYCGSGNGIFSGTCDGLCEQQCQGAAGCRLFHENFCGVGNDRQNELEELTYIFGGNEPDLEPPFVEIVSPEDGAVLPERSSVNLRAVVDDDYGGYGWRFVISYQGEVVYDFVDYDREVDAQYRAALNLVNLEAGIYEIMVEVADHFEHTSVDVVTFTVEGEVPSGDTGHDETGAGSGGEGSTTDAGPVGEGTGSTADTESSAGAVVDEGDGCACTTGPGRGGTGVAGLLLALLALGGPRRGNLRERRRG
jgi:MYXO-CTERM domain-containing protein